MNEDDVPNAPEPPLDIVRVNIPTKARFQECINELDLAAYLQGIHMKDEDSCDAPTQPIANLAVETGLIRLKSNNCTPADVKLNCADLREANLNVTNDNDASHYINDICNSPTDVLLEAEGQTVKAHSVLLSAVSPFFKALFSSGMSEVQSGTVKIIDVKFGLLCKVVSFVYTGYLSYNEPEFDELFRTCHQLQVSCLLDHFEDNLVESVSKMKLDDDLQLVCDLFVFADNYYLVKLCAACIGVVRPVNFDEDWNTFLELPVEMLVHLLKDDNIRVSSEDVIVDLLALYLEKKKPDVNALSSVLEHLRLPFLTLNKVVQLKCILPVPEFAVVRMWSSRNWLKDLDPSQLRRRKFYDVHVHILWGEIRNTKDRYLVTTCSCLPHALGDWEVNPTTLQKFIDTHPEEKDTNGRQEMDSIFERFLLGLNNDVGCWDAEYVLPSAYAARESYYLTKLLKSVVVGKDLYFCSRGILALKSPVLTRISAFPGHSDSPVDGVALNLCNVLDELSKNIVLLCLTTNGVDIVMAYFNYRARSPEALSVNVIAIGYVVAVGVCTPEDPMIRQLAPSTTVESSDERGAHSIFVTPDDKLILCFRKFITIGPFHGGSPARAVHLRVNTGEMQAACISHKKLYAYCVGPKHQQTNYGSSVRNRYFAEASLINAVGIVAVYDLESSNRGWEETYLLDFGSVNPRTFVRLSWYFGSVFVFYQECGSCDKLKVYKLHETAPYGSISQVGSFRIHSAPHFREMIAMLPTDLNVCDNTTWLDEHCRKVTLEAEREKSEEKRTYVHALRRAAH